MFPKLTFLQWVLFILLFGFYGFAVFALTRDYYLRNPPQALLSGHPPRDQGSAAQDRQLQQRMRLAVSGAGPEAEIDLDSNDPIALGQAADQLFGGGDYAQAIRVYQRVLELAPEDAETHNDLGLALHYVGRSGEAAAILEQGTRLEPDFQRIWLSLGFVSLQTNRAEVARQALSRAQALDPSSAVGAEAGRLLGSIAERDAAGATSPSDAP